MNCCHRISTTPKSAVERFDKQCQQRMVVLGYILLFFGCLIVIVGNVMFLTVAYRRNPWWFVGCLFVLPVAIVFLLLNLKTALKPFAISIAGLSVGLLGAWLAGVEP